MWLPENNASYHFYESWAQRQSGLHCVSGGYTRKEEKMMTKNNTIIIIIIIIILERKTGCGGILKRKRRPQPRGLQMQALPGSCLGGHSPRSEREQPRARLRLAGFGLDLSTTTIVRTSEQLHSWEGKPNSQSKRRTLTRKDSYIRRV